VDFLKFRNVNDDAFNSCGAYNGDASKCSSEVQSLIEGYYTAAKSKLEANFRQKPYAECALKEIKGENYENLLLKASAIDMKGVGLKFWKLSKKNSRVKDLQEKAQEIVDSAVIKCKGQIDYGAFFDSFYEQKRGDQFNDNFDYCMRKYLVDRNVFSPNQYNFKVNPKNIRTDGINCDEIMKTALEQLKAQTTSAGTPSCIANTFIDKGYLDLILKIQLLSKLNLTPQEKQTEKQIFVTQMINMTHSIRNCPT
jgi:hypothetical protein